MTRKRGFLYDKDKFSKDMLYEKITRQKKRLKVSNAELGNLLGITGQAFSNRLSESNFDYIQLIKIFKRLKFTDAEMIQLMTQEQEGKNE